MGGRSDAGEQREGNRGKEIVGREQKDGNCRKETAGREPWEGDGEAETDGRRQRMRMQEKGEQAEQLSTLVLLCEDSLEGIFTGVYTAYALRRPLAGIRLKAGEETEYRLFSEYRQVLPDEEKTCKVIRTLQKRFGMETYRMLCMALSSEAEDKAQAVFGTIVRGLEKDGGRRVMEQLTDGNVRRVMELGRYANNEMMHLRGFLRFQEVEGGILYAVISPANDVLPFLAEHFSDRFPMEHFLIYDERRNKYAVHPRGKEWFLLLNPEDRGWGTDGGQGADDGQETEEKSEKDCCGIQKLTREELCYQELFSGFCHTISIKERKNLNLQCNMLPLHFRKYMVEFQKK